MKIDLPATVALLVALSIASERLVEIIKGAVPPLNQENPDPAKEGRRKAALQFLAVLAGIVTTWLAWPAIDSMEGLKLPANRVMGILALGLLASGGSGFWNSVLTYVTQVKDIKEEELKQKKLQTSATLVVTR